MTKWSSCGAWSGPGSGGEAAGFGPDSLPPPSHGAQPRRGDPDPVRQPQRLVKLESLTLSPSERQANLRRCQRSIELKIRYQSVAFCVQTTSGASPQKCLSQGALPLQAVPVAWPGVPRAGAPLGTRSGPPTRAFQLTRPLYTQRQGPLKSRTRLPPFKTVR
jgi:hypothetical protein